MEKVLLVFNDLLNEVSKSSLLIVILILGIIVCDIERKRS